MKHHFKFPIGSILVAVPNLRERGTPPREYIVLGHEVDRYRMHIGLVTKDVMERCYMLKSEMTARDIADSYETPRPEREQSR